MHPDPARPAGRATRLDQKAIALLLRQHRKTMTGRWAPLLTPAARAASPNRCSSAPVPRPLLPCWVWTVSETGPARGCASAPLPLPNPGRRGRRARDDSRPIAGRAVLAELEFAFACRELSSSKNASPRKIAGRGADRNGGAKSPLAGPASGRRSCRYAAAIWRGARGPGAQLGRRLCPNQSS
jgi:hypothetical protein